MSLTYTEDTAYSPRAEQAHEPFTPVYARTGKSRSRKGGVPASMILAPIGVLGLGALGALALSGGGEDAVIAETAAPVAAPLVAQPVTPMMEAPLAAPTTTPAPTVQPAPVAEVRAAPAPRATAPRAAAPRASAPRATARTAAPVEAPVVELSGPQPYAASAQTTPAPAPFVVTPSE